VAWLRTQIDWDEMPSPRGAAFSISTQAEKLAHKTMIIARRRMALAKRAPLGASIARFKFLPRGSVPDSPEKGRSHRVSLS
jgi:hypothetical protein